MKNNNIKTEALALVLCLCMTVLPAAPVFGGEAGGAAKTTQLGNGGSGEAGAGPEKSGSVQPSGKETPGSFQPSGSENSGTSQPSGKENPGSSQPSGPNKSDSPQSGGTGTAGTPASDQDRPANQPTGNTNSLPPQRAGKEKSAAPEKESGSLEIIDYDLSVKNSSQKDKEDIRRGDHVRLTINVKSNTLLTENVGKDGVKITKLLDSFRLKGSSRVVVTSRAGELLNFKVTFTDLVYSGSGDSLKFAVRYSRLSNTEDTLELSISESIEKSGSGGSDDERGQPMIFVKRGEMASPVSAGEVFTLPLIFENLNDEVDVENLIASFDPGDSMVLLDITNYYVIKNLYGGNKAEVYLKMQAGQELSGVSQTLGVDMKFDYYDGSRKLQGSASHKILIPVKTSSQAGQPLIRITRGELKKPAGAGQKFSVTLNIENLSKDKDIKNLIAVMEPGERIYLTDNTDSTIIGDLKAGASTSITVGLQAGEELTEASQLLGVNLKFDYDSGKGISAGTFGQKIVIPTDSSSLKVLGSPTPNIIISKYNYGDRIAMGQEFNLDLEFVNTSKELPVENIVMSLETGEGLSITSSSNTFYIPSMAAGTLHKEMLKLRALPQTKLDSPKITISFKYEYIDRKERKQATGTETIAIPVYQPDRFSVRPPDIKDAIVQNEETTLSIPYVNKGKAEVSNVEAKLEGDVDALEKQQNLGNFEAGKSGTIDFIITPKKAGTVDARVLISYEDAALNVQTVEVPLHLTVTEPAPENQGEEENEPEHKSLSVWVWILPAVLVSGALGGLYRKKKKKGSEPAGQELADEPDWGDEDED